MTEPTQPMEARPAPRRPVPWRMLVCFAALGITAGVWIGTEGWSAIAAGALEPTPLLRAELPPAETPRFGSALPCGDAPSSSLDAGGSEIVWCAKGHGWEAKPGGYVAYSGPRQPF